MERTRPILVTGSIRGGTTWVGRMIGKSSVVGYIHEPFNPWHNRERRGVCDVDIPYWFTYMHSRTASAYYKPIADMLRFRYKLWSALRQVRSWQDVRKTRREHRSFSNYRSSQVRPLVKDPFSLFSVEWLAETFDFDVVILIRHPAAVVSSIKRLGWGLPIKHLMQQSALIRDHLRLYEAQIREYVAEEKSVVDQSILFWKLIYSVVHMYQSTHPNWIYIRHEDLARNPISQFESLFRRLGIEFTPEIRGAIAAHSSNENPWEVSPDNPYLLKRDSQSLIWNWKKRLTESEIKRVWNETRKISSAFYSDDEW